jgi:hypothetical protein
VQHRIVRNVHLRKAKRCFSNISYSEQDRQKHRFHLIILLASSFGWMQIYPLIVAVTKVKRKGKDVVLFACSWKSPFRGLKVPWYPLPIFRPPFYHSSKHANSRPLLRYLQHE